VKRLALVLLLAICCNPALLRAQDDDRYTRVGSKIQCTCGCGDVLIKCNHVGCQSSDAMIRQLRAALVNYKNDEDVLNWFRKNYGVTSVIAPATHGFELTIWVVPPVLLAGSLLFVFLLARKWRDSSAIASSANVDPRLEELRARARRETEL
jgi:cytochrome c-type biogenesis protein CcmH/NrfF